MNLDGKTEWEIVKLFQTLEAQGTGIPTKKLKHNPEGNSSVSNAEVEKYLSSPQALAELWGAYASRQALSESSWVAPIMARIKLKMATSRFAFKLENFSQTISPFAMTPVAVVRGDSDELLESCSFCIVRPELPGMTITLKMSGKEDYLQFNFLIQGNSHSISYILLKDMGDLAEMQSLTGGGCSFYIPSIDTGTYSFTARTALGEEVLLTELDI